MPIVTLNLKLKIRSNLCDYEDAYIWVKATISVPSTSTAAAPVKITNEKVILKIMLHLLIA